ncbi:isopentenyl-diphosphate Delta-isomerase [Erwinia sp. CPCC 100877]|nr:isopentenyl-diphosphate Delta-isomerase [Erwinia sp. CPCC 100877]
MNQHDEQVLLLDDDLRIIGTEAKSRVHSDHTPLHLAFSSYIFNQCNELLLTRRALCKKVWPGVWTNSVCGHPMPHEAMSDAVRRRCQWELGLTITQPQLIDNDFRYFAVDVSGIIENEYCPVWFTRTETKPQPRPDEVMDYIWIPIDRLLAGVSAIPAAYSPWMVGQLARPAIRSALASLSF